MGIYHRSVAKRSIYFIAGALLLASFAAKKQNINVVFIGDSITHGTMAKNQSPPIYAGDALQKKFKSQKVTISNQGVSGQTTLDYLPGTGRWRYVRKAADSFYVDKSAVLVFSIMLGTNDSAMQGTHGAPVSADTYRNNLKLITDSLLAAYPGCKVVINHPIWYSRNTHNRGATYLQEGFERLKSYLPQIDALVKAYQATTKKQVYVGDTVGYALFEHQYLTLFKPETYTDGTFYLHPNKEGDITLGGLWADAIAHAVK